MRIGLRLLPLAALLLFLIFNTVEQSEVDAVGKGSKRRRIALNDLGTGLAKTITPGFQTSAELEKYLDTLDESTTRRVIEGEFEHLIYYILQSRYFTSFKPIEPALSSKELFDSLDPVDRDRLLSDGAPLDPARIPIPVSVRQRVASFKAAVDRSSPLPKGQFVRTDGDNERWRYFSTLVRTTRDTSAPRIEIEYLRTMRFLYRKEFLSRQFDPAGQADYISGLYRTRAHSTDTQIEAGFGVDTALALIGQIEEQSGRKRRFSRVLIVGPGQDLAPRTGLLDQLAPQSFQPFTLLDSLRRLGLADPRGLNVHCVDVNQRVIDHIDALRGQTGQTGTGRGIRLDLVSGLTERYGWSFSTDFKEYFLKLGVSLGTVKNPPGTNGAVSSPPQLDRNLFQDGHLVRQVEVPADVMTHLSAERLNIITERYDPSPQFDLVVVTNVFPYFEIGRELPLSIANLAAMTVAGGWLVHNELSIIGNQVFNEVGLPVRQVRTLMIASGESRPLYDGVVIHQRQ